MTQFSDLQLDALRELANIGSGTASTSLSEMLGCAIEVSVPTAAALSLADAVDAVGDPGEEAVGVAIPLVGDIEAMVLLVFGPDDAATLCGLLGVEPDSEFAESALGEIGNILGTSYISSFSEMTGLALEPSPPQTVSDMLGAIVASALAVSSPRSDTALLLDSELKVEVGSCSFSFLLLPTAEGVTELLARLGLGE